MTHLPAKRSGIAALACLLVLSSTAVSAQAFRMESLGSARPGPVLVQAAPENAETVRLLSGLAKIESDLQLGLLFLADGLQNPEGSHFFHPRRETYPGLRDGLIAAGIEDFEPLLVALEAGGDKAAVMQSYTAVIGSLMQARATLAPAPRDMLLSIIDLAKAAADEINPEGATDVQKFQDAWAMLMVARNQLDLLMRADDAAVATAAQRMATAFDDVILSMPDPNAKAPVTYDPSALILVIQSAEALVGSA